MYLIYTCIVLQVWWLNEERHAELNDNNHVLTESWKEQNESWLTCTITKSISCIRLTHTSCSTTLCKYVYIESIYIYEYLYLRVVCQNKAIDVRSKVSLTLCVNVHCLSYVLASLQTITCNLQNGIASYIVYSINW